MGEAALLGVIASSALVIGALLGTRLDPPKQVTGVLLALASGSLISALAFELFGDAFEFAGGARAGVGLLVGALTFVVANSALDSHVRSAEAHQREKVADGAAQGVGFALLAAVVLDGVPENLALGVALAAPEGSTAALLVAIFLSNLPEALVGTVAMRKGGRSGSFAIAIWVGCAVTLALAVILGRAVAGNLSEEVLGIALGFAGGAVLASLADTLMPEAFESGKPFNSMATCVGFFVSFLLAHG